MFEGKNTFQCYLLVQLLQQKQVVLFSQDGEELYLFYHGTVYTVYIMVLATVQRDLQFPTHKSQSSSEVFIWSLFDIRGKKEPHTHALGLPTVFASADSPIRFSPIQDLG